MAAACRSAEEAASSLELRLAQAETDAAAAVLGQQQAQARRNTIYSYPVLDQVHIHTEYYSLNPCLVFLCALGLSKQEIHCQRESRKQVNPPRPTSLESAARAFCCSALPWSADFTLLLCGSSLSLRCLGRLNPDAQLSPGELFCDVLLRLYYLPATYAS